MSNKKENIGLNPGDVRKLVWKMVAVALGVVTEQPIHRFRINALILKAIINN